MNHPYGTPIIGWRAEMEGLTRADALAFYERFYAPDNAILVVAGDVSPDAVRALAETHFGALEPSGRPRDDRPQEPPQLAPRRLVMEDPRVRQPYVARQYLVPSRVSGEAEDAAALAMLSEILGGSGVTSRLGRALQVEQGVAISAGAYYSASSMDPSGFGVYAVPSEGVDLETVEAAMDAVIATLVAEGPTEAELARARAAVRASEIYAQDSQMGLARTYGAALAVGLTVEDVQAWPDQLSAVTAEDVKRAAAMLDPNRSVTGWLTATATEETQG
jgi:zinc protease